MKKVIAAGLIAGSLFLVAPASAHQPNFNDTYDDSMMHPLRLAYYAVYPVAFAGEWLVARPLQFIISRDAWSNMFGYGTLNDDAASYSSISN